MPSRSILVANGRIFSFFMAGLHSHACVRACVRVYIHACAHHVLAGPFPSLCLHLPEQLQILPILSWRCPEVPSPTLPTLDTSVASYPATSSEVTVSSPSLWPVHLRSRLVHLSSTSQAARLPSLPLLPPSPVLTASSLNWSLSLSLFPRYPLCPKSCP